MSIKSQEHLWSTYWVLDLCWVSGGVAFHLVSGQNPILIFLPQSLPRIEVNREVIVFCSSLSIMWAGLCLPWSCTEGQYL